jgi:hypothetical protein
MRHDVFGEIAYNPDEQAWTGSCPLPVFAEYGRLAPDDYRLPEPAPEFDRGLFAFTIQDETGDGPSVEQANAIRFLRDREAEVCHEVMMELVEAIDMKGGIFHWLQQRRDSRLWGWLARLVGPEYTTPDDLRPAVRCTGLEVSQKSVGAHAYLAFYFETIFGTETEHGLSVVYHPQKDSFCGDASAIHDVG